MASAARTAALRMTKTPFRSASTQALKDENLTLKRGARKDPELYVLGAIMAGAFGLAGYYFGRKPTSASSEAEVSVASSSMPWQVQGDHDHDDHSKHFKYQYHPQGDKSQTPRNAPSALNSVVLPSVTLPKELHDKFNKWGKESY
ncbi:hypothetical protein DV735_g5660, partial [Chaetothyriales sp. CBS 134920]